MSQKVKKSVIEIIHSCKEDGVRHLSNNAENDLRSIVGNTHDDPKDLRTCLNNLVSDGEATLHSFFNSKDDGIFYLQGYSLITSSININRDIYEIIKAIISFIQKWQKIYDIEIFEESVFNKENDGWLVYKKNEDRPLALKNACIRKNEIKISLTEGCIFAVSYDDLISIDFSNKKIKRKDKKDILSKIKTLDFFDKIIKIIPSLEGVIDTAILHSLDTRMDVTQEDMRFQMVADLSIVSLDISTKPMKKQDYIANIQTVIQEWINPRLKQRHYQDRKLLFNKLGIVQPNNELAVGETSVYKVLLVDSIINNPSLKQFIKKNTKEELPKYILGRSQNSLAKTYSTHGLNINYTSIEKDGVFYIPDELIDIIRNAYIYDSHEKYEITFQSNEDKKNYDILMMSKPINSLVYDTLGGKLKQIFNKHYELNEKVKFKKNKFQGFGLSPRSKIFKSNGEYVHLNKQYINFHDFYCDKNKILKIQGSLMKKINDMNFISWVKKHHRDDYDVIISDIENRLEKII